MLVELGGISLITTWLYGLNTTRQGQPIPAKPYDNYGVAFPNELDIIGVAEPGVIWNERYTAKHNIPQKNRFVTWEHVFEHPKFAVAIIITTPDNLHYVPCMQALEMRYNVLLEKPIAPTEEECRDILALVKRQVEL